MKASMHEAKTHLSELVRLALSGEDVLLTSGKSRTPIARIVPIAPAPATTAPRERPIGLYAEEMGSGPIAIEPLTDEELEQWENASLLSSTDLTAADPTLQPRKSK